MIQPLVKIGKRRDKDPTKTRAIRERFIREVEVRFNEVILAVQKKLVDENYLQPIPEKEENAPLFVMAARKYTYEQAPAKIDSFGDWLDQLVKDKVLSTYRAGGLVGYGHVNWTDVFIQSAYQQGIADARADLASAGAQLPDMGPVYAAMNRPFHADRAALLYIRAFNDMKGVTEAMKSQMSHELALGMAEGRSPYDIAYKLRDRVEKIGITRGRLIARTEVVRAHNQAALNEYDALEGIVGEEIKVQWWTALDERVRSTHQARHSKVYKRETAMGLIGEPNCRCALLPWTKTLADARVGRLERKNK